MWESLRKTGLLNTECYPRLLKHGGAGGKVKGRILKVSKRDGRDGGLEEENEVVNMRREARNIQDYSLRKEENEEDWD